MAIGTEVAAHGFSMWELFWQADWVVKGVILALVGASVWSWAIMIDKVRLLTQLNRTSYAVAQGFNEGMLEGAEVRFADDCPFVHLLMMTQREWRRIKMLTDYGARTMAISRLEQLMGAFIEQKSAQISSQLTMLVSMGSLAPFVALFGTVWGIMNSFQSIALSKNTSLAVVAPGIAEALFATAIGFLVAIPAVMGYHRLSASIQNYSDRMGQFAQELLAACMRV